MSLCSASVDRQLTTAGGVTPRTIHYVNSPHSWLIVMTSLLWNISKPAKESAAQRQHELRPAFQGRHRGSTCQPVAQRRVNGKMRGGIDRRFAGQQIKHASGYPLC
jgi:hypothetical protein